MCADGTKQSSVTISKRSQKYQIVERVLKVLTDSIDAVLEFFDS